MQLPFSVDHPHTPITQYSNSSPPYVPNVMLLPEAQTLLVPAASMVANDAAFLASTSPARMFCYNLLSSSGWQNTAFSDVVKLACDSSVLKARSGMTNTPASALHDAVNEVLALYTSSLIMSYPALAQQMHPDQVASAHSNSTMYQMLLSHVESLYAQSAPYTTAQHRFAGVQVGHQSQMPGRSAVPAMHVQSRHGAVNRPAAAHGAASGMIQSRNQVQANVETVENNRFPTPGQRKAVQAAQVAETPKVNPKILTGDIEKMDREAHSIVYFGKKFELPTAPLRRNMEESVEKHEAAAKAAEHVTLPLIGESWFAEASLDELVATTRANRTKEIKNGLGIFLNYGFVVTPVISPISMDKVFSKLSQSNNFADIGRILNEAIEAAGSSDQEQLRLTLCYVSQIDRFLTKVLNDFLGTIATSTNSLPAVSVDSFVEDAGKITRYLNEKFNGRFNNAYSAYQQQVTDHLFKHAHANGSETDAIANLHDYITEAYWDNLVLAYSVIYISASSQELGYLVGGEQKEITSASTPMLHRLIAATQKTHSKDIVPSHHVIVTADDMRFKMMPVAAEPNVFLLKEI